jgi:hypothetical protein
MANEYANSLMVTLGTKLAGEDLTNDVMKVEDQANYTNTTASVLVKTGAGRVFGFIINSHTAGTLKLWDNTSAATTVLVETYTFTAGSGVVTFPAAVKFTTGLYATIGGTANVTIIWS